MQNNYQPQKNTARCLKLQHINGFVSLNCSLSIRFNYYFDACGLTQWVLKICGAKIMGKFTTKLWLNFTMQFSTMHRLEKKRWQATKNYHLSVHWKSYGRNSRANLIKFNNFCHHNISILWTFEAGREKFSIFFRSAAENELIIQTRIEFQKLFLPHI